MTKSSRSKVSIASRDVVPHLRVDLARAVGEQHRKIRLPRALLPDLLRMHEEDRGRDFIGLQIGGEGRFHLLEPSAFCTGVVGTGDSSGGAAAPVSFTPVRP